jgi:hypothetical protein
MMGIPDKDISAVARMTERILRDDIKAGLNEKF